MADSQPFRISRPKPPPAPPATSVELRMAKLSAALCDLCDVFDELSIEQNAEETQLRRAKTDIPARLVEIDEEEERAEAEAQAAAHGTESMYLNTNLPAEQLRILQAEQQQKEQSLRLRIAELRQERSDLKAEVLTSKPLVDARDAAGESDPRYKDTWHEAVPYLAEMINSSSRTVRIRASESVKLMCECSDANKRRITERLTGGRAIAPKLVDLLRTGALEAIGTVRAMTDANVRANDTFRESGAISLLAGFISSETAEAKPGMPTAAAAAAAASSAGAAGSAGSGAAGAGSSGAGAGAAATSSGTAGASSMDLADVGLAAGPVPSEAAAKWGLNVDDSVLASRPTIVPVEHKSEAVAALRNFAMSSEANLDYLTKQSTIIPQLVVLMTKMNEHADDNSSLHSGSKDSDPTLDDKTREQRRDERRSKTNDALKAKMEIELHERKKIAKENRKLAESAGKMLHTLIVEGKTEVKRIIISAIIEQVQQPGSVPPKDVPALMEILQSTAREQLSLVQDGKSEAALQAALGFGRWINLPTLMLGEARNAFKAARDGLKKEERHLMRQRAMGMAAKSGLADEERRKLAKEMEQDEHAVPTEGGRAAASRRTIGSAPAGAGGGPQTTRRGGKARAAETTRAGGGGGRKEAVTKADADTVKKLKKLRQNADRVQDGLVRANEAYRKGVADRSRQVAESYKDHHLQEQLTVAGGAKADFLMFEHDARISLLSKAFRATNHEALRDSALRTVGSLAVAKSTATKSGSAGAAAAEVSVGALRGSYSSASSAIRAEFNRHAQGRQRAEARAHGFNPTGLTHRAQEGMRPTQQPGVFIVDRPANRM